MRRYLIHLLEARDELARNIQNKLAAEIPACASLRHPAPNLPLFIERAAHYLATHSEITPQVELPKAHGRARFENGFSVSDLAKEHQIISDETIECLKKIEPLSPQNECQIRMLIAMSYAYVLQGYRDELSIKHD